MGTLFRILYESVGQAWQQLRSNRLRTLLSLLGIIIGIFCIIAVLSAIDSLESNIRSSFDKLGDDVIYISKLPWNEDPEMNYWKYARRPNPDYDDYEALGRRLKTAEHIALSVFVGMKTAKFRSSSVEGAFLFAVTDEYSEMFNVEYAMGRNYSRFEYQTGANKVIIGWEIAENLFANTDPLGKWIKVAGRKLQVIGVIEKSGDDLINPFDYDRGIMISYPLAKKIANVKTGFPFGVTLAVKAGEQYSIDELRDDVTVALRIERGLKPSEGDNFSLNELSMFARILNQFFGILNIIGIVIGAFATLVGAFSVANIMFVSVKERTKLIGIKKALGAKRYMILLEFLIESIVLCVIGGVFGLVLVFVVLKIVGSVVDFEMFLSLSNIVYGLVGSVAVGIISGIIPAYRGASLDPVNAMRK